LKILVINAGSSSLKYQLIDMDDESVIAKGICERIGNEGSCISGKIHGKSEKFEKTVVMKNHTEAFNEVKKALTEGEYKVINDISEIAAVGHRIVQGGALFNHSVLVDDDVIKGIESLCDLAPLHNAAHIQGIKASIELFGKDVPQVVVFDNAFHSTMPPEAYLYAIPTEYYEKYGIRKYGFHGTSHRYVTLATAEFLGKKPEDVTLITCHLGNGCSMAAVKNGKVIDTTMGLTPLEGLMMGTRSGDLDPAVVIHLIELGHSTKEVDTILNKKSGLYGVGGINSGDMRDMINAAEGGNEQAELALKMFARRVVKYVGAYYVLLGGADALVFTGGVGEYSVPMRKRITSQLGALGLKLDDERNKECFGKPGVISTDDSKWKMIVMPTDEELMIATDTVNTLGLKK